MPSLLSAENFNIWRKCLLIGTQFALTELSSFLKVAKMSDFNGEEAKNNIYKAGNQ